MKKLIFLSIILLSTNDIVKGSTYILTSPERNVRIAPLIIDAIVLDIRYEKVTKGFHLR